MTARRKPLRRGERAARVEGLTSDAWYTLFSISPSERLCLAQRRRRIWAEPLLRHGFSRADALALLERRDRWTRAEEANGRTPHIAEQLRELARWSGAPIPEDDLVARLDATLLKAKLTLAPGAAPAVRSLDDAGIPLAIVSNVLNESGHAARTILERMGLLVRFRAVVLSCEHPFAKPAAGPFVLAARFLGLPPGRIAHVGDLGYDLLGARRAGMHAWWYVGLRRWNRYLPGQVAPGSVRSSETITAWSEIPRRFGLALRSRA